jgi:hypothetical protein
MAPQLRVDSRHESTIAINCAALDGIAFIVHKQAAQQKTKQHRWQYGLDRELQKLRAQSHRDFMMQKMGAG